MSNRRLSSRERSAEGQSAGRGRGIDAPGILRRTLTIVTLEGVLTSALLVSVGAGGWARAGSSGRPWALAGAGLTLGLSLAAAWAARKGVAQEGWLAALAEKLRRLGSSEARLVLAVGAFYVSILILLAGLLGVSLRMNPGLETLWSVSLGRGLPALGYVSVVVLHTVILLHALAGRSAWQTLRNLSAGGLATLILLAYWYGAEGQLLVYNVDPRLTDQSAYMDYARRLVATRYSYPGDFNRMPVYPLLLSLAWRPGMTDPQFFLASKYLNLFLSVLLLAGLAFLFAGLFDRLHALNLVLIAAFTVFIYKAGWVQAELLFYFLNTCLFLLLWRLLQAPNLRLAALTGVVAGLAHLTKASLWPALALFAVFGLFRGGLLLAQAIRNSDKRGPGWVPWRSLLTVPVAALAFLIVLAPYLQASREITGRYFYNVNSTFYLWYDSWEEAEAGTKAHGDRVGWPQMPESEIPSPGKYLREHSIDQVFERVRLGGQEILTRVWNSYGYADYIVIYAGLLLGASVVRWRRTRELVSRNFLLVVYFAAYFTLYAVLYFWYAPIAAGDRLILAQFLPLLLVLSTALFLLLRGERLRISGWDISWWTVVNVAILILVSADALWALRMGVYVLRGGG